MISRWIVHIEAHWGYRPRFSVRRAPRAGDRIVDGGQAGRLAPCPECSGVGFFHVPDPEPGYGLALLMAMSDLERGRLVAEKNRIAPKDGTP